MSYGTGRERRRRLGNINEITETNVRDFLGLAANEFAGDYPNIINERAAERETETDKRFLSSVAGKDLQNAFNAFQTDVNRFGMRQVLQKIVTENTNIRYNQISADIRRFFESSEAKSLFFKSARGEIRKILQAPIQLGLSRTVLQKYLQK